MQDRLLGYPVVGRPPIGAVAKDAVIACRVTDTEKAVLTTRYGKPSNFLRIMVEREMQRNTDTEEPGA